MSNFLGTPKFLFAVPHIYRNKNKLLNTFNVFTNMIKYKLTFKRYYRIRGDYIYLSTRDFKLSFTRGTETIQGMRVQSGIILQF